jgi:hypothetical protein
MPDINGGVRRGAMVRSTECRVRSENEMPSGCGVRSRNGTKWRKEAGEGAGKATDGQYQVGGKGLWLTIPNPWSLIASP